MEKNKEREKEWEKEQEKEWEKEREKELEKEREKEWEKELEPINISDMIDDLYNNVNIEEKNSNEPEVESEKEWNKDLDISWIKEHERLSAIHQNYLREPMESINLYFIYINRNLYIEKIIHDKQPLCLSEDKSYSYLSKEILLQIIQSRKIKTPFSKYKLTDVLSYLVNLEPDHIQYYSKNENFEEHNASFLKVLNVINDIQIDPSIFIFHEMNSIYFLFQEVESMNHRHTLKSILKTGTTEVSNKTNTKKVRIELGSQDKNNKKKHRGTRKKTL
jgi:hypothetical protein